MRDTGGRKNCAGGREPFNERQFSLSTRRRSGDLIARPRTASHPLKGSEDAGTEPWIAPQAAQLIGPQTGGVRARNLRCKA